MDNLTASEQAYKNGYAAGYKAGSASGTERESAKWIKRHNERTCSKCKFIYYNSSDDFNFCPNCGRKMF